ncbi:MAG: ribosome maturation factor RimM [Actinobacteria bacterium]|nr:ribosome maturation factor RimM [Actinomycetota bacterium]
MRGQVVVEPITNRRERFQPGARHYAPDDRVLVVEHARAQKGRWVVTYSGVTDRDGAEALRGVRLAGDPIDVLDAGEMWVHELIGAEVVELSGTSRGRVVEVEANPAHDILVLESGALVPVVFVRASEPGRIVVDVPDGIFDEEFVAANRAGVERRPARRKRQV